MPPEAPTRTHAAMPAAVPGPTAGTDGNVHAVVLVDLIPDRQAQGAGLLVAFVEQARQDDTIRAITLIQQAGAPNHYIIDMTFTDRAAYRRFVQEPYVRSFRESLFEHLGSPWDERTGPEIVA